MLAETVFIVFAVLFAISFACWVVSLFFIKRTLIPMLVSVIFVNIFNLALIITKSIME